MASVPDVVIGLPVILKTLGTEAATLVTVPEPPPLVEIDFNICHFLKKEIQ